MTTSSIQSTFFPDTEAGFSDAVAALHEGRCVCYPTETLYAVGCNALDAGAVEGVYRAKRRPNAMPLPVIIGHREQLAIVSKHESSLVSALADLFWPGPLSILVTASDEMPTVLTGETGRVAVRLTPHPVAAKLCRAMGGPLVSTSANISGRPAVVEPDALDPDLVAATAGVVTSMPLPQGGKASTLVEIAGPSTVRIVREGAIGRAALQQAGVTVLL